MMRVMREDKPLLHLWLWYLIGDALAVVAAYATMLYLRFYSVWGQQAYGRLIRAAGMREPADLGPDFRLFYAESAPRLILILALTLLFLYGSLDLHAGRRLMRRRPVFLLVAMANLLALVLFYSYFYVRFNVFHPRTVFISFAAFNIAYCFLFRSALTRFLRMLRRRFGIDDCRAVLIGAGPEAQRLADYLAAEHPHGIRVAATLVPSPAEPADSWLHELRAAVQAHRARLIFAADPSIRVPDLMRLLQLSEELGVEVKALSPELGVLWTRSRLTLDVFFGMPCVHFGLPPDSSALLRVKRMTAAATAAVLLLVLSPFLALLCLLIRLSSRGPAFFVQERIGVNRVPFRIFKFRTMHHLADDVQSQVEAFNESGAGLFKIRRDPRVTGIGRVLRRFSLDELPQLFNVVRGEMVFVGPRPLPRRDFQHYYEDWHYIRHAAWPGLTCLWQISGRSDVDFHNMCILDVYYLRNQTLMLDLKILMRTIGVVLFAKGAY